MAAHSKPKMLLECLVCHKQVAVRPHKLKTFKYCSNECKTEAKRRQVPHNKMTIEQKILVRCANETCKVEKWLIPYFAKKFKYCSEECARGIKSKNYQIEIVQIEEKKQENFKKRIWFL